MQFLTWIYEYEMNKIVNLSFFDFPLAAVNRHGWNKTDVFIYIFGKGTWIRHWIFTRSACSGFRLCECSSWVSDLHIYTIAFDSRRYSSSFFLSHLCECGKSFYNLFHLAIVMPSLWSSRADNCRLIVYKEWTQPSGGCCAQFSIIIALFTSSLAYAR